MANLKIYGGISKEDLLIIMNFINGGLLVEDKFKFIGSGSYAKVYKYKNYAVKVYKNGDKYGSSYYNDARILELLQDFSIYPKLYASKGGKFMVMELIEGWEVADYSYNSNECIPLTQEAEDICYEQMEKTLMSGILIKDIHDQNVMYTKNGEIKIVDVGYFVKYEGHKEGEGYERKEQASLNDMLDCIEKIKCRNKSIERMHNLKKAV